MSSAALPEHGRNQPSNMFFWVTPDRPTAVRAEGIHIWDQDGKRYIDASSGPQTCNIGHGNPRVRRAMAEQAEKIAFAFRPQFMNEPAELLAADLARLAPDPLDMAFFVSGGSEAVEAALKLARTLALARGEAQRFKLISRIPAYHGATLGALSVTGDPQMSAPFAPMIQQNPKIPAPFCTPTPPGRTLDDMALQFADCLETEILNQGAETVLAFILEPVGGASTGGLTAPDVYYRRIREICDAYGVLLIYDEVMSGAGRTGKFLAAEHWDGRPDIVAMAKGLASGYMPLGAVLTSRGIVDEMDAAGGFPHGHTYSAHPLACAVGRAVLAELVECDLIGNAARMGALLQARLEELRERYGFIGEVRGRGLLLGFDVVADRSTGRPLPAELNAYSRIAEEAYRCGLVIYSRRVMNGLRGDHFLVTPPLIVSEADIDEIVALLAQALDAVAPELEAARGA